jgi:hypothetical protein
MNFIFKIPLCIFHPTHPLSFSTSKLYNKKSNKSLLPGEKDKTLREEGWV